MNTNMTMNTPTPKIRLKRLGETKYGDMQWSWRDFIITRKTWCLPVSSISYRITKDDKTIDDLDTLRDVREYIAEWLLEQAS
jgi:hypothetical protein